MEKLNLLIDAKNFCFRAGVVDDLTNKKGQPVYLLYVGMKMLRKLAHDLKPTRIIFLWDGGSSKWRRKIYPDYRVRSGTSGGLERYDDILSQIRTFENKILPLFPVYQWKKKYREADDLIHTAVMYFARAKQRSVIVSTDKDFYQLLPYADIFSPTKEKLYTKDDFKEEYGFDPKLWVRYRAMTGDSSDNIKGVEGIGKVTARKIMVDHHASLEEFYLANPNGKKEKKAYSQLNIFSRNFELMDLASYPFQFKLAEEFASKVMDHRPSLYVENIKDYLLSNQFLSILKSYPSWIRPFERMM